MRTLILSAALLATIASLPAQQVLPTTEGSSWEYESTEELGGPGAGPAVHSVVTVRVGRQQFEGRELIKFERVSGEKVIKTELVTAGPGGLVCVARSGKDGKLVKIDPPETIVPGDVKVGTTWERHDEVAGLNFLQHFKVEAEENVMVPAGRFRAFRFHCAESDLVSFTVDRWFVPGTGFVKEVTVVRGPNRGLLERTTLELSKSAPVAPKPTPTATPAATAAATPTATRAATPTATRAATPSITPTATPTATPAPSATPSPSQPEIQLEMPAATPSPPVLPPNPFAETPAPEEASSPAEKRLVVHVSDEPSGQLKTDFKSNVPNIYVRWQGNHLPENARVRVAWVAEDVGDLVETNFVIDETESVAPTPNASARFTLGRPPDGWAEGIYRLEFYIDDALEEKVRVTIEP